MTNKNSNKVFIPLTLDNSTKSTFGEKQMLSTAALVVIFLFLQVVVFILRSNYSGIYWYGSLLFLVPLDLVVTYSLVWIFRKAVMNENMLLKVYSVNKSKEVTDLGFMWDIFDIKGSKIYYISGWVGTIVDVQHGYIFDRPENHPELHRAVIRKAIGDLEHRGYHVNYFNREVKDSNLEPLLKTEKLLQQERGSSVYNLGMDILNHTKSVCRNIATTEHEYFLIIAPDMYTIQNLDLATEEFINNLHGGLYNFITRLSGLAILDWFCSIYGVKFIDTTKLLSNRFKYEDMRLITVLETIHDDSTVTPGSTDAEGNDDSALAEYERMLAKAKGSHPEEGDIIL